jgi:hypothetical protein
MPAGLIFLKPGQNAFQYEHRKNHEKDDVAHGATSK